MSRRIRPTSALSVGFVLAICAMVGGQVQSSQALFGDAAAPDANSFTSGAWRTYYLHNNPTPPTGNTNRQANLPLTNPAPTAGTLYNYDANADSGPGRYVGKGGAVGETDIVKYQNWRTPVLAAPLTIDGTVTVVFWSAMKDFGTNKAGAVQWFLRSYNPGTNSYTELGNGTATAANWQGGSSTWVSRTLTFTVTSQTLVAGRQLEIKLVVGGSAGDDMWFAYDTVAYPSRVILP